MIRHLRASAVKSLREVRRVLPGRKEIAGGEAAKRGPDERSLLVGAGNSEGQGDAAVAPVFGVTAMDRQDNQSAMACIAAQSGSKACATVR